MKELTCPTCLSTDTISSFTASEKLLGSREKFSYGECGRCGTVRLLDDISDFSPYYPQDYHCFEGGSTPTRKKILLKHIALYSFAGKDILGKIANSYFKRRNGYSLNQDIARVAHACKTFLGRMPTEGNMSSISVLDLGCGGGGLLKNLASIGFSDLTGVEPYGMPKGEGVTFIHSAIDSFIATNQSKKFDIIVMSHVLEHLYNHKTLISGLKSLLSDRGVLIIAMPFTGKLFRKFRENRLSLDAPRHVIIHSPSGFKKLLETAGLRISDIWYEQRGWDIFASEMYTRDIGFSEINALHVKNHDKAKYNTIAEVYNMQQEGGSSVTFFITK